MLNRSNAHNLRFALARMARGAYALVAMVALCAVSPGRARANLVITPTFDSTITSDPNAAAIEGTINSAIGVLEADISTPITVSVYFQEGDQNFDAAALLSDNQSGYYWASYYAYYNALKAIDTAPGATSAQRTALASLGPAPSLNSGNPVNGYDGDGQAMVLTSPNLRALGLLAPPANQQASNKQLYDSIITFNPEITYPPNPNTGSNYALEASMLHELDEVLGIGGGGSSLGPNTFNDYTDGSSGVARLGPVGPMDLFRYSASGVRSFSLLTTTSPYSYFSIDGGNTVLSYFNQSELADYGDWLSDPIPAGYGPQVQDAYATRGADPTLGVNELTALEAIGYTLAVPEPTTMGIALCGIVPVLLRRKRPARTAG